MENGREPNWNQWKHVPYAKIWEAVALSLNIDPMKVRETSNSWPANEDEWPDTVEKIFDESDEFEDRVFIAGRNLGVNQRLLQGARNQLAPAYWDVNLAEFAAWARSVDWHTPEPFAMMAASQAAVGEIAAAQVATPEANRSIDAKDLGARERSTLLTIIAALAKALKLDVAQTSKTAASIESLTVYIDARVAARTIENHLKLIPDALERKNS
jgi:hypothetical protein